MILSGKEVIVKVNRIESKATIHAYVSLILYFVSIPKANKPNKGPYVKVANLNKLLTTFPSKLLNKITTKISKIETPICTFLRNGFCCSFDLFSIPKKSTENDVVKEVKVIRVYC